MQSRPVEEPRLSRYSACLVRADARTRTGDPFITSEVLYQLSYVGKLFYSACKAGGSCVSFSFASSFAGQILGKRASRMVSSAVCRAFPR